MKKLTTVCLMLAAALIISSGAACAEDTAFSDPSKVIEAGPCCEFAVSLESNKTTGFGWDIAEPLDENVVRFVSSEYVAADTGLVGSGGREIWTFRAVCPGKCTISFKYVRPWEKDVPPARKMAFPVVVK